MMIESIRKSQATINLNSLVSNYHQLKSLTFDGEFFCPMVKCNAYGHGANEVMNALLHAGANSFGVSLIEEGKLLRKSGIKDAEILVFSRFTKDSISDFIDYKLTPVITSLEDFKLWESYTDLKLNHGIHLKIDTGMHRMGINWENEWDYVVEVIKKGNLKIEGLCTHLAAPANISCDEGSTSQLQLDRFLKASRELDSYKVKLHVLSSVALIERSHLKSNLKDKYKGIGSRPGIGLYGGVSDLDFISMESSLWAKNNLTQVMCLYGELLHLVNVKKGEGVSYGPTWSAKKDSLIGVVGCGYGDGIPRRWTKGKMLYNSQIVPIVGTICMDYTLVDLSEINSGLKPKVGDLLEIFGDGKNSNKFASIAPELETISYEMMCSISGRIPRVTKAITN